MTTTAYDCDCKVVACDSRWSAKVNLIDGDYILLVDDTGFNKIISRKGGILICAGDGLTIEKLKEWWSSEPFDPNAIPDLLQHGEFKVSIMMISLAGERMFDAGHKHVVYNPEEEYMHAIFSGSGGGFAANTFMQCGCAKSSVDIAKLFDPWTGGEVKFIDMVSCENNVDDETMDYNSIMKAMELRGVLMKFKGHYAANSENVTTIPLREHAQANQIINELQSGSIHAYAPMGGSEVKWTSERVEKLKEAARKIAKFEETM
ncbi:hypothetical protein [Yersinia enterocolitica]|uniref:hypothetical protein n=1 Tax=Yersinia enterocolitica TaxID=630 RepID=UPI0021E7C58F|nr:hypothetical protein [Yersinia enterocolitica]EKN3457962.1 hypothetical protein [Yersinia enterocolitica]EKN4773435.1 hypothetical protein [Yersinia enterocolitica]EKN5996332.1 hypothetical protein [Yersinia enterocolitica]EKN6210026.1 hypothetical protein [Yersinia enterocolitica]UYK04159.1 hypothetical protein N4218_11080 [Yersinia enterocolitica]